MNLAQVTLSAAGHPGITLGTLTRTSGAVEGFTLETASISPAERSLFTENLPLVPGGVVTPGRLSTRSVDLAGTVVAATAAEARAAAQSLIALTADRGDVFVTITYNNGEEDVFLEGLLDGAVQLSAVGGPMMNYALRLTCPDPIAKNVTASTQSLAAHPGAACVNAGNADVWPSFTVNVPSTATGIRVGNSTTGLSLTLNDLSGGGELVLSSAPGYETALLDDVSVIGNLSYASRFFPFEPGSNSTYLTVVSGTGSATGVATWRSGWVA